MLSELDARLGRRLQQPQQQRVTSLRNLVVVAFLAAHDGEDNMTRGVTVRRRLQGRTSSVWQQYARQIGEVAIAWNWVQAGCFSIFEVTSAVQHPLHLNIARNIWHSFQSDKAQRQMMLDVARPVLGTKSRAYIQLKWFKDTIDKLAASRNDPIHTPVAILYGTKDELIPHPFWGKQQAVERLRQNPLSQNWRKIRGDLYALLNFAVALQHHIIQPLGPLPRRPRMLSLPKSPSRTRQSRRGRGKPQPPPPS